MILVQDFRLFLYANDILVQILSILLSSLHDAWYFVVVCNYVKSHSW